MRMHGSWITNQTFLRPAPGPSSGRVLQGNLRRLGEGSGSAGGGDTARCAPARRRRGRWSASQSPVVDTARLDDHNVGSCAPTVGQWIDARYESQVKRLPRTSLAEFVAGPHAHPDVILIADVMHHIPKSARHKFLDSVAVLLDRVPSLRIIVKDVEPGHWRALLGFWSDRYVTGDRNVSLISRDDVTRLFEEVLGPLHREDTDLFKKDSPNYAIVFHR